MKLIPEEYFKVENTRPMDNRYYLVPKLHQAFHHYIKVRTICARTPLCVYVYSAICARTPLCVYVYSGFARMARLLGYEATVL
jgi:hypothetical protein